MSPSDQDSMSDYSSSMESPRSSPMQQVPRLVTQLTGLQCVDYNFKNFKNPEAYLRIIEQPQNHFRFRYKSEMVGTHGCILGKSSPSNKAKTHPTVELVNYNKKALIRCQLVQHLREDEHPHQLLEDEHEERDVSALVPVEGSYRVGFPGLGIIHTAKKQLTKLLENKYIREQGRHANSRELKAYCESEVKNINPNIVRLKFSAHDYETGQEVCEPVFSEPIHNMKSAATNDLKICRSSRIHGKAKGGDDVFIFVEKVNKKNIEIQFVERNQAGDELWMAKAQFLQTDVHHQYGIVFRTPAYKDQRITTNVKVCMELFRPSDGRRSDPVEFTYRADPLSRQKKGNNGSPYSSWNSSLGTDSIKSLSELPCPISDMLINTDKMEMETECEMSETPNAVPQIIQNSSNVCLGDALYVGSDPTPYQMHYSVELGPMMPQIDFPDMRMTSAEFQQVISPTEAPDFSNYLHDFVRENLNSYNFPLVADSGRGKSCVDNKRLILIMFLTWIGLILLDLILLMKTKPQGPAQAVTTKSTSRPKPETKRPKIAREDEYTATFSPEHGEEVRKLVKEICDLVRLGMKKQEIKEKLERLFKLRLSNGDTFLHMTLWNNRSTFENIVKLIDKMQMPHLLNLTNDLGQTILHLAVVRDIPEYMSFLISKGCDPSIGDKDDNTAVHVAVQHQACVQPLLAAVRSSGGAGALDARNKDKQTALHLAAVPGTHPDAVASSVQSIELLLQHGASHNARDHECRTPLHLAVYDDCLPVVRALLKFIPQSDIDVVDGNGNTALQIACGGQDRDNTVDIVKLLIEKKADPLAQCGHAESAWRVSADKPPLRALLAPLVPAHAEVKHEPEDDCEAADEAKSPAKPLLVIAEADAEVKSEPEDDYESADEGEEKDTCLSELSLYLADVSRLLDGSGAWRSLAERLQLGGLANWFENTASPSATLLHQVKACQDSSITSKTLILMLEDLGQKEAARLIRSRIGIS